MTAERIIAAMAAASAYEGPDRATRLRAAVIAGATGRTRRDQKLSLMAGEVIGAPGWFTRNVKPTFRGALLRSAAAIRPVRFRRGRQ